MRPNELDYRRLEWDNGYNDFREAVKRLEADLQAFLREWIERPVPTTQVFEIFKKFQPLADEINLGLNDSYQELLRRFAKQDIEHIRKVYNKHKQARFLDFLYFSKVKIAQTEKEKIIWEKILNRKLSILSHNLWLIVN